jgi:AcrR family transcriptional regulator
MSNRDEGNAVRRGGRRPGPSGTREAILAAAGRHFAENGYDRASLRGIAAGAGVDQKLIAHFFGSKQQPFVAAVGLPFNPGDVLPAILAGERESVGERLAAFLVDVLEQPELHQRLTGVVRAAASEPEVAGMLREFLTRELFLPAAELLGTEDGSFRANLVGSQIVGLVMARYVIAIEPLASMPPRAVAAAIAPTLERYLLGPLEPTREPTPPSAKRASTSRSNLHPPP